MIRVNWLVERALASPRPALLLVAASTVLSGCAADPDQQVWTTKNQSVLSVNTTTPSLSPSVENPIPSSSVSAAELREPALSILMAAAESPNPLLRANAIEALHAAPDQLPPVLQRCLGDENRAVRFAAAMTVGRLKIESLASLLGPMLHDESQSVQAATMYALHRCGRTVDLNPLAAMLLSEDPEVKGNAALVLGELGEKSAIPMLQNAAGKGLSQASQARRKVVELQLAEAMVKLGAKSELEVIRAALFAPVEEAELAALACQMSGELKDFSAVPDLSNIVNRAGKWERPPEVRMAAALAIARIDPSRADAEVPTGYSNSSRPELRAQAAHTLGVMSGGGKASVVALAQLSRLMNDANPLVQVAAAGGILRFQPKDVP